MSAPVVDSGCLTIPEKSRDRSRSLTTPEHGGVDFDLVVTVNSGAGNRVCDVSNGKDIANGFADHISTPAINPAKTNSGVR